MKTSLRLVLLGCLLQPLASLAQQYCQPVYADADFGHDFIDAFVLGNINNVGSGPTATPGYVNYTYAGSNSITSVASGGTYAATITTGNSSELNYFAIWVDLDHDFVYEPNERLADTSAHASPETFVVDLTIPAGAKAGYTGIRVMCAYNGDPADPCGAYTYGETEDYTVIIDDGSPCIPVYGFGTTGGDYIDGVIFGDIYNTNSGGTGTEAYSSFVYAGSSSITSVAPGSTTIMTITAGNEVNDVYSVWVDLDQNGSFGAVEMLAQDTNFSVGEVMLVNVTIPANARTGYARLRVMCTRDTLPPDPCGAYDFGETEDYAVVIDDGAPCIPVFTSGIGSGSYIDGVVFGTITNTGSGGTTGGPYSSYVQAGAAFITSTAPGGSYPMTITSGSATGIEHYTVWVDLDQDGTFDPTERLAMGTTDVPGEDLQLMVNIPADASTGYTRMRVMCTYFIDPTNACGTFPYGETEDYTLVIDDGTPCIPVYASQASQGHFVMAVELAGINYGPVSGSPGYVDATHLGAHLQAGVTSNMLVTSGTAAEGYIAVAVDWNMNGFEPGEIIGVQPVVGPFLQLSFNVTPPDDGHGYVRMRVTFTDSQGDVCDPSAFGNAVDFALSVSHAGWPCLPLQGYGTRAGDGFTDLQVGTETFAAQTEFPYYDWAIPTPNHYDAGASIALGFHAGAYAPETYRLWMDMNDDGDFSDADELLGTTTATSPGQFMSPVCQIPANCPPGQHFMRLRANDEASYPLQDPCEDQPFGQLFDWLVVVEDPNGPCIPFMGQWTTEGDFIDGVQLGGAQNLGTGGQYGPAYSAYLSPAISVIAGMPDTLRITGGAFAGDSYSAWIDYNADNDFDDADELLGWIGIADPYAVGELPFTVPNGTVPGNRRMRVRCSYDVVSDACATMSWGETEDYTVSIEMSTGLDAAATPGFHLLPTGDGVQLVSDASYVGYTYTLIDATGRVMSTGLITSDRTDLPMTAFAKGTYMVRLSNGLEQATKRFVW